MRILLVDDDSAVRDSIAIVLSAAGHMVEQAANGIEGMRLLRQRSPDLVITDILMPQKEGIEIIREIRSLVPATPIIAISGGGGSGQADYLKMAQAFGANAALAKPFDPEALLALVKRFASDAGARLAESN
jgi:DNA-binding response OmpR family regulator